MTETLVARNATVECLFCGTLNRVDLGQLGRRPKCGACERPMHLDRPQIASDDTLEQIVRETEVPLIVDFYADWCAPCQVMAPRLDDLARERAGHVLVVKVNTDHNGAVAKQYEVRGIPTLIVFTAGREVARQVGLASGQQLDGLVTRGGT